MHVHTSSVWGWPMVFLRSGSPDTQGLSALSPGKEERGGERERGGEIRAGKMRKDEKRREEKRREEERCRDKRRKTI